MKRRMAQHRDRAARDLGKRATPATSLPRPHTPRLCFARNGTPTVSARKTSRLQCGGYSRAAKSTSRTTVDPQGLPPGSGWEGKKSGATKVVRFPAEPNAATRKRAGVQACSPAGGIRGWPPRSCTVVTRGCTGAVRGAALYRKGENRGHLTALRLCHSSCAFRPCLPRRALCGRPSAAI
jgi:hypothetical protein